MSEKTLRYFVVDAFTSQPFTGNPAAVVPLTSWPSDSWLQALAMEMNLSETAYFAPEGETYRLRWFTPKVEVDLCGHATLATSRVMSQLGLLADGGEVRFATRSGILTSMRRGEKIEMDFPLKPVAAADAPGGLATALGVKTTYVGRSHFDYLVEVESAAVVRTLRPDFAALMTVDSRGTIVTARSDDPKFDFVSRFFAPQAGINEDPATGSAHCVLADYWSRKLGKARLAGYQASWRGATIEVEVRGQRCLLGGQSVLVAQGELLVPVKAEG